MKKIVLVLFAVSLGLVAYGAKAKKAGLAERNATTQYPIMPIMYCSQGNGLQEIYLTDYLPQVTNWDNLRFETEPSYQVVEVKDGVLSLAGDQTLSVLHVEDVSTGCKYDIPVVAKSSYEVGLVTKAYTDSTITIGVLNEYEHLQFRVLWQNTRTSEGIEYGQYDSVATIKIEPAWRNSKGRTFIRVFAMGDGKQLNDLLIPLENGKVVACADELTRFDDHAQILYSLMIDRFENGNKKNDWKMNSPEVLDIVDYQGGDLAGITKKIKDGFFAELGITTIWISPITQNPWDAWGMYPFPNGNKYDNSKKYTKFSGYHGYWPIFATVIDKRFGTDKELKKLLSTAHANGMNVVLDYVANHMHINSPTLRENPTWHTDSILPDGRRNFELWDEARLTTWFDVHIPTLDLERPEVCGPMTDSAMYWLENYDFDGFRHDACKHIPLNYWRELGQKMKQRFPDRHIWMIGETYGNTELIGSYVKTGMLNAQFDFNIYHTAIDVFGKPDQSLVRMNQTIMESLAAYGSHHTMGNISGNHDKCRFISLAGGAVRWDESDKAAGWTRHVDVTADGDAAKEAHAYKMAMLLEIVNFTIPGVPCVYQGDEYAEAGANDPDNRHMLKFKGLNKAQTSFRKKVQELAKLRREHMALIYGEYVPVKVTDDTLHFQRVYMGEVVEVIITLHGESSISVNGEKVFSIQ
jgi:glycosidase